MKLKKIFFTIFLFWESIVFSQNVGINASGTAPDASAGLDVNFNNKGLLIPRVDISDLSTAAPISSPATSLIVYNTNTTTGPGYFYWNGSRWVKLFDENDGKPWLLSGNAGTTAGTDFIGTTDAQDLVFKTNGTENMRINHTLGYVGIGTPNPGGRLEVNVSPGSNGGDDYFRVEMSHNVGITLRSGLSNGNPFIIFSNDASNTDAKIQLNGDDMLSITGANVGIEVTSPSKKLEVDGDIRIANNVDALILGNAFVPNRIGNYNAITLTGPSNNDYITIHGKGTNDHGEFYIVTGDNMEEPLYFGRDNYTTVAYPDVIDMALVQGKVGIATTTPNARLTVITNGAFDQFSLVNSGYYSGGWARGGDLQFIKDNNTRHRGLTYGIYGSGNNLIGAYFSAKEDDNSPWNTAQLFLHSSGGVGIGTNQPRAALDVNGQVVAVNRFTMATDNTTTSPTWHIDNYNDRFRIFRQPNINTAGTEFFTIKNSGNTGIGTSSPITVLHVAGTHPGAGQGNGNNSDAATETIIPAGSNGSSRKYDWPNGWGGGISTWDICGSGIYENTYLTRSDKRYKKDIKTLKTKDLIDKFMQLKPVSYNFNPKTLEANPIEYKRRHFGFIANEVEEIFPDIVVNAGMPDNIARGLEYDAFIPITIAVVQQQQQKIKTLEQQIKTLQEQINELKKKTKE